MSCGLEQFGLQFAPVDAIEPGPVRDGFAALNKAMERLYQMLAPGRPALDGAGNFVRDDADGAIVRGPINLFGAQCPVPPQPIEGPAGPPGPIGDPGGWYLGVVMSYQPPAGGDPIVVVGSVAPTYLIPHVHTPATITYSIDGITWLASGTNPAGYANVVDGVEKTAETGPAIDDGGVAHHHEFRITAREAWDFLSNSGGAIAS